MADKRTDASDHGITASVRSMSRVSRYGLHKRLADRFGALGDAVYILIGGLLTLTLSGLAASLLREPLLFPSLGPTAILFFETPMAENASPRNTFIGHAVGLAVGWLSLAIFGLHDAPGVIETGISLARAGAAALSVALTGAVLILADAKHAPAGATTLIVSLGLLAKPRDLLMIAVGVIILTVAAWLLNRMLGVPVPVWTAGPLRRR